MHEAHVRHEINKESAPARKLREFVFRNGVFTDEAIIPVFQYANYEGSKLSSGLR